MARRKALSPRELPRQARSRRMTDDVLQAAARVPARDGPAAFTTNRVAEVAGVGVGSLHRYSPNEQAPLLRLEEREREGTRRAPDALLSDRSRAPRRRPGVQRDALRLARPAPRRIASGRTTAGGRVGAPGPRDGGSRGRPPRATARIPRVAT